MLKIGLTGGIGSGKTTVANIFRHLGISVYTADVKAKELVNKNTDLQFLIKKHFGEKSFNEKGYNREYMAKIVFSDPEKLSMLNSIIHPAVFADFLTWCESQSHSIYIIHEAAIMAESGADKFMDKLIVVDAPEDIRVQRVAQRDNSNASAVKARIASQLPTDKLLTLADWVIVNDNKNLILPQILKIHNQLLTGISHG